MENKITFEDIQKANETIITTNVKGKDYAEVNQRIKAFRMVYPQGSLPTEMLSNENGVCIFKASVYTDDGKLLATGTAYEKEGSTFINKTSYIENCETSALGRALGIAGFGIDTSVASAEEVQNAIKNQESEQEEILKLMAELKTLVATTQTDYDKLLAHYKVTSNKDMSLEQLRDAVKKLRKKVSE